MAKVVTEKMLKMVRKKFVTYAKFWKGNPVAFVFMVLKGVIILPYQAKCLESIANNKRTIVKSGHGAGKTFTMALCAVWWLCFHWIQGQGCSVIVTGPSMGQLKTTFWPQFTSVLKLLPPFFRNQFTITAETAYNNEDTFGWRIDLRTASKDNADSIQGQHNVLFLIDEWSAVPRQIYIVIEGAMSDEGSKIFTIGNPTENAFNTKWGYDAFHKQKHLWSCITINCEEWPSTETFTTTWTDITGIIHQATTAGRCDPKEFKKWLDIADGNRDANDYRIRIRGEFPLEGKDNFIPISAINRASKALLKKDQQEHAHVLALDPATSGGDDIAMLHRNGRNVLQIKTWQQADTLKIGEQVKEWLATEGANYTFKFLYVDAIGDGKGVYDYLKRMHTEGKLPNVKQVIIFKASYESLDKEETDRLRDYTWFAMKKWITADNPHFPTDSFPKEVETLVGELSNIQRDFSASGKLKVESKKAMKRRGIKSPNIADALSMTFYLKDDLASKHSHDKWASKRFKQEKAYDWRAL